MANSIVTIPKRVSGGEELVVVRRREFDAFRKWQEDVRVIRRRVRRSRTESLKDFAHPGRVRRSYRTALRRYPPAPVWR